MMVGWKDVNQDAPETYTVSVRSVVSSTGFVAIFMPKSWIFVMFVKDTSEPVVTSPHHYDSRYIEEPLLAKVCE